MPSMEAAPGALERKVIGFTPQWEGSIEGWAKRYSLMNAWRVAPQYDADDLMSEAWLLFCKLKDYYPAVVDAPHFMRLFTISFRNLIIRFADTRTKRHETAMVTTESDESTVIDVADDSNQFDELEMTLLIQEAPKELQALFKKVFRQDQYRKQPNGTRETHAQRGERLLNEHRGYVASEGKRETTNELLCRLAGRDPQRCDLVFLFWRWLHIDLKRV